MPGSHFLGDVYPNPLASGQRGTVNLTFGAEQPVTVTLHDMAGRTVRTLYDGLVPANRAHALRIDATGLASGMYMYHVQGISFAESRSLVLTK